LARRRLELKEKWFEEDNKKYGEFVKWDEPGEELGVQILIS